MRAAFFADRGDVAAFDPLADGRCFNAGVEGDVAGGGFVLSAEVVVGVVVVVVVVPVLAESDGSRGPGVGVACVGFRRHAPRASGPHSASSALVGGRGS